VQPTALVLDFDGTLAASDVGDDLCEAFAPPEWLEIDQQWLRREISLPEAQRRMWALVRATPRQVDEFLATRAALRPGLDALLDEAERLGMPIVLASGGFDFYIERMLGEARLGRLAAAYYNRGELRAGGIEVSFPWDRFDCGTCAVCKGLVCRAHRPPGGRVVFVGDGSSDACALAEADRSFVVRGSLLERLAAERGCSVTPFDDLAEVAADLGQ
jgi:2-hydroxy-3-keto-5-methylthiopentenyl-1-phosphate phosphatase